MNRTVMYYGAVLVVGGLGGFDGLLALLSGNTATAPLLRTVGGLSFVVRAGYQLTLTDDPSESVPGRRAVQLTVLGASLMVIAYFLRLL